MGKERKRTGKPGFVYFAKSGSYVKIGHAVDVPTRFSGLKTATPHDIELLAAVPGGRDLERRFHQRFSSLHHRGEWFRADGDLLFVVAWLAIDHRDWWIDMWAADPYLESLRNPMLPAIYRSAATPTHN